MKFKSIGKLFRNRLFNPFLRKGRASINSDDSEIIATHIETVEIPIELKVKKIAFIPDRAQKLSAYNIRAKVVVVDEFNQVRFKLAALMERLQCCTTTLKVYGNSRGHRQAFLIEDKKSVAEIIRLFMLTSLHRIQFGDIAYLSKTQQAELNEEYGSQGIRLTSQSAGSLTITNTQYASYAP